MRTILASAAAAALALLVSCKSSGFKDDPQAANMSGRTYATDVERVWQSLQTSMKELDLDVEKADHDALGGQMTMRRATGEEVFVRVRSVNPSSTTVDIAAGDRNMAQMIQDKVAEKLGADRPGAPGMAAGSSVQGTYENPLPECAAAAERALKAFNLPVDARENHDVWIAIRSKHLDAIPVSVKLMRTPKDQTDVTFTVGTSPSDDNTLLANRLKKEFEAALGAPRQP
ncbi:MAG TPA: DUF3568 family protein [Planctomycetota bacterium]